MTGQGEMFVTCMEEALEDSVRALGGYQQAAHAVWPTESPLDKGRYLRACLDPDRREKLSPGELVVLAGAAARRGCLTPAIFLAESCGCMAPVPAAPEDVEGELLREIRAAREQLATMLERAERLNGRVVPMEARR